MAKSPAPVSPNSSTPNGDEQLMEKLKQSSVYIIGAIVIALAGFFGWSYWQNSGAKIDSIAADKYAAIEMENNQLLESQDPNQPLNADAFSKLNADIDALVAEHGSTIYAWQALMIKARNAMDTDNFEVAIEALQKALTIELDDPGLHAIAQLRYATVLLASGDVDAAMKQAAVDIPISFEPTQQELLGDIYLAKNDQKSALRSYQNAWSMLAKRHEQRDILRLKLESLGVVPEPIDMPAGIINQPPISASDEAVANAENETTESEEQASQSEDVADVNSADIVQ